MNVKAPCSNHERYRSHCLLELISQIHILAAPQGVHAEGPPLVRDGDSAPVEGSEVPAQERAKAGFNVARFMYCEHHPSRAASAFYSPYEDAVVPTTDGVGEWLTTRAAIGSGKNLELSLHGYELDLLVLGRSRLKKEHQDPTPT